MTNRAITIGNISLEDFEIPTCIRFGGRQKVVIHRTANGMRTVEPLGPDDGKIDFEGVFSGAQAEMRTRALDNLRLSGNQVWMTWQSFRYKVMIEEFAAVFHSRWWISYRISCVVVHQAGVKSLPAQPANMAVSNALLSISTWLADTDIDLAGLASAVNADGAFIGGTMQHLGAVSAIGNSRDRLNTAIAQCSLSLLHQCQIVSSVSEAPSVFLSQIHTAATLSSAVNAGSYLGAIASKFNV